MNRTCPNPGLNWFHIFTTYGTIYDEYLLISKLHIRRLPSFELYTRTTIANTICWTTSNEIVNWLFWLNYMELAREITGIEFMESCQLILGHIGLYRFWQGNNKRTCSQMNMYSYVCTWLVTMSVLVIVTDTLENPVLLQTLLPLFRDLVTNYSFWCNISFHCVYGRLCKHITRLETKRS